MKNPCALVVIKASSLHHLYWSILIICHIFPLTSPRSTNHTSSWAILCNKQANKCESSIRPSSGISHHPLPLQSAFILPLGFGWDPLVVWWVSFISELASNLAITSLTYQRVQSVDSFQMAPHTCQDYLEISESTRYVRATSCTLWRKVLLNSGSVIKMYLTYVDLSEPETFYPLLSYVCLNMHTISCNSRFVVMDTDGGGEKKVEKRKGKHHLCP